MTPPKRESTDHPNIFKYANESYYWRGTIDKTRVEIPLKTKKWRVALREAQKVSTKNNVGEDHIDLYVEDVVKDFLEWKKRFVNHDDHKKAITEDTYLEYEDLFERHLLPFYKFKKLEQLDDINEDNEERLWLKFKDGKTIDLSNIKKVWGNFKKWCQVKGYIKALGEMPIPQRDRRKGRILEPEELASLLKASNGNLFLLVLMYSTMAMRKSEILKLEWSRVLFKDKAIMAKKKGTRTKTNRVLPINDKVLEILIDRKKKAKGPYVFPNKKDARRHADVRGLKNVWKTALKNAGIEDHVTMHDLRKTWAVFANMNPNFTDMQRTKFAGHSKDIQRDNYAHLTAKHLKPLTDAIPIPGLDEIVLNHQNKRGNNGGSGGKVK